MDVIYDFQFEDPDEVKHLFLQRRLSNHFLDLSGVWRYRELLPFCTDFSKVVSMQEGNTPIYDGPAMRGIRGAEAVAPQAPGTESHRIVQGQRHDRRSRPRPTS